MDTFIKLPYGEPGSGFHVSELISHVRSTGLDYIIQGQQHCGLDEHTKPQSLGVWLREGFTTGRNTAQARREESDEARHSASREPSGRSG